MVSRNKLTPKDIFPYHDPTHGCHGWAGVTSIDMAYPQLGDPAKSCCFAARSHFSAKERSTSLACSRPSSCNDKAWYVFGRVTLGVVLPDIAWYCLVISLCHTKLIDLDISLLCQVLSTQIYLLISCLAGARYINILCRWELDRSLDQCMCIIHITFIMILDDMIIWIYQECIDNESM